jgi:hypothetical protein
MPKNKVSDPITDLEMAFALLVLSGGMTDRQAAEAVGLNPDSAAYIKSKPTVRTYMLEHRAAVEQQLVQQEADLSRRAVEGLHRLHLDREQVLNRLWEIANLSSEMTRGSVSGQVKALSMIIAMENLIPDRRALNHLAIHSEKAKTNDPQQTPAAAQQKNSPAAPARPPASAVEAPPNPGPNQSTIAKPFSLPEAPPLAPYIRGVTQVPDLRIAFAIKDNPFTRPR